MKSPKNKKAKLKKLKIDTKYIEKIKKGFESSYLKTAYFNFSESILNSNSFYDIPDFQRHYVWSKTHLNTLLNDINKIKIGKTQDYHYLGSIVQINKGLSAGKDAEISIIDGQQRLTSMFILFIVIAKLLNNSIEFAYSSNSERKSTKKIRLSSISQDSELTEILESNLEQIYNYKKRDDAQVLEYKDNNDVDSDVFFKDTLIRNISVILDFFKKNHFIKIEKNDKEIYKIYNINQKEIKLFFQKTKHVVAYNQQLKNEDIIIPFFININSKGKDLSILEIYKAMLLNSIKKSKLNDKDNIYNKITEIYSKKMTLIVDKIQPSGFFIGYLNWLAQEINVSTLKIPNTKNTKRLSNIIEENIFSIIEKDEIKLRHTADSFIFAIEFISNLIVEKWNKPVTKNDFLLNLFLDLDYEKTIPFIMDAFYKKGIEQTNLIMEKLRNYDNANHLYYFLLNLIVNKINFGKLNLYKLFEYGTNTYTNLCLFFTELIKDKKIISQFDWMSKKDQGILERNILILTKDNYEMDPVSIMAKAQTQRNYIWKRDIDYFNYSNLLFSDIKTGTYSTEHVYDTDLKTTDSIVKKMKWKNFDNFNQHKNTFMNVIIIEKKINNESSITNDVNVKLKKFYTKSKIYSNENISLLIKKVIKDAKKIALNKKLSYKI